MDDCLVNQSYDPRRVLITKDVKIFGEKDNKGNPLTKIIGGVWSFYSPLPAHPYHTTWTGHNH